MKPRRNTDSVPGEWYIDTACINCGASRHVAPGLIVERNDKSVFVRQPVTPEEHLAAWRAVLVCPTASVRSETKQPRPNAAIFPEPITSDVWRCGFNARSSFGADSYFARRPDGNLLIDSPPDKYALKFGARVWIHREDMSAAPYATDLLDDGSATDVAAGVRAIPVPGHTRGSVVYLLDDSVLFSGDSLAWSPRAMNLVAFRDACWYSWSELTESLGKLSAYRFDWLLPGHGWLTHLPAEEMRARLLALVVRMRKN
ncbi:ferredoxin [Paraburkholderia atlantica]|uniref:4Fe-4S domain-containing protein n=1 Tax=Paraburkholderia atlantica TaxID=2654982 RepID=UPI00159127E1|nr:ferredoxin [Paraburkholderia atlantica]NUY36047.1 MBL fold metallo-hydrolase [Paraburkholderia atlantica]